MHRTNAGFTLIELLVVLAILGALTVMAVRSVENAKDGIQFEQNQAMMAEVESSLFGSRTSGEADFTASSFLEDVGRMPLIDPDPERNLRELWIRPASIAASHVATDPIDPEIKLAVGWRGPYLKPSPGDNVLRDAWGHPVMIVEENGKWTAMSMGADGSEGGGNYGSDLEVVARDAAGGIDRTKAEVTGTIIVRGFNDLGPNGNPGLALGVSGNNVGGHDSFCDNVQLAVKVFAYVPNPANGEMMAVAEDQDYDNGLGGPNGDPHAQNHSHDGDGGRVFTYSFTGTNGLTPGRRILRAYVYLVGNDPRTQFSTRSAPVTVRLAAGAQNIGFTAEK
jgi:prepilin-type N-terminal cleavage/methylation domain-containing protein